MDKFFILLQEGMISVSKCKNEDFEILRYEGEIEQRYDPEIFWLWFKEKIEYDGKEFSFIVLSDDKEFLIDDSIKIASTHRIPMEKIIDIIDEYNSEGLHVITFPKIDLKIPKKQAIKQVSKPIKSTNHNKSQSLQKYFKKQTSKYKKGEI